MKPHFRSLKVKTNSLETNSTHPKPSPICQAAASISSFHPIASLIFNAYEQQTPFWKHHITLHPEDDKRCFSLKIMNLLEYFSAVDKRGRNVSWSRICPDERQPHLAAIFSIFKSLVP